MFLVWSTFSADLIRNHQPISRHPGLVIGRSSLRSSEPDWSLSALLLLTRPSPGYSTPFLIARCFPGCPIFLITLHCSTHSLLSGRYPLEA